VEAITATPDELLSQLEQKAWYSPTLAKMREQRQREWLTVRVLLRKILGEEKQILYTDSGKPYLADSSYYISISHTKGYVAIALDENDTVAVDIEQISPQVENVRSRFMNETEERNISQNHPLTHWLLHWSAKETLFKYLNDSDIEFKSQLHIHPFEPIFGEWGEFTAHETRTTRQQSFLIRYIVKEEYVLTVAYHFTRHANFNPIT
jgi:4'-phosphopantetheinyl transferase EntD